MRYLVFLAGIALLVWAGGNYIFVDMSVHHCLDKVGPGFRTPCVQPEDTLRLALGRHWRALAPATLGALLIVYASVDAYLNWRRRRRDQSGAGVGG